MGALIKQATNLEYRRELSLVQLLRDISDISGIYLYMSAILNKFDHSQLKEGS